MQVITLADPITGLDFSALQDAAQDLTVQTAFNGAIKVCYDPANDVYIIPAAAFKRHTTMTLRECAEYLGVSRARISHMCSTGMLKSVKVRGSLVIDYESVHDYQLKRGLRHADSTD